MLMNKQSSGQKEKCKNVCSGQTGKNSGKLVIRRVDNRREKT